MSFMHQVRQVTGLCRGMALFFVFFFGLGLSAQAAPGDLDTTFGTGCGGGCVVNTGLEPANAIVRQPDGKLLIGGGWSHPSEEHGWAVIRYNAEGTPDDNFGNVPPSPGNPGYAMRCSDEKKCEGAIIGKALEPLEQGTGVILMLITR